MQGRLTIVLALASILAGCASPTLTQGAVQETAAPIDGPRPEVQVPSFLAPVTLGTMTAAEPSVAVAPDGTVYVATPLAFWRSTDGGKTYEALGKESCPRGLPACGPLATKNPGLTGGGDGSIAVTPSGRVHWLGLGGGVPYQHSDDQGESWSEAFDVADKHSSDREWVTVNRTGSVFVQWRDFGKSDADKATIMMRASDDDGGTFRDAVVVGEDGHQGPIAHDPSSAWLFLPHVLGETGDRLVVARSMDGGATWEDVDAAKLVDDTFQFPIAAVDQAGTLYVVYANGNFGETKNYLVDRLPNVPTIQMIVSKDHGATWSEPKQVSATGRPAVFPWLVAGAPGRVAVAYYQAQQPLPLVAPNVWTPNVAMSTTADADEPQWAVGVASKGPSHVGQICVVGSACGPQDRSLLDFFEIRALPDGTPVLAFVQDGDVRRATIKVVATVMEEGTKLWD